jgi:beta-glucosidase
METIAAPLDFLGLNIYSGDLIGADGHGGFEVAKWPVGHPLTMVRWPIAPAALRWAPLFLHERYRVPIYITENGMANTDWVGPDGRVHDPQRIEFLGRYLRELDRAITAGADVRGYFHWSILDNFEWAEGYSQRFGLVYVDYATQKRTLKDSAYWYAGVIATNGAALGSECPTCSATAAVAPLATKFGGGVPKAARHTD